MERCLLQVKRIGVLEDAEHLLPAGELTECHWPSPTAKPREFPREDILMLGQIMSIEMRMDKLKDAFERYRRCKRNSRLLGVALQIIRIIDGLEPEFVSVGGEAVKRLYFETLTRYFLGKPMWIPRDREPSMAELVFTYATGMLREEHLESMDVAHRRVLDDGLRCCDLTVSALRELFFERAKYCEEIGSQAPTATVSSTAERMNVEHRRKLEKELRCCDQEVKSLREFLLESARSLREMEPRNSGLLSEAEADYPAAKEVLKGIKNTGSSSISTGKIDVENPNSEDFAASGENVGANTQPSSWRYFQFDREEIMTLTQEQLASLWAAYIVRNNDTRQEDYRRLQDCIVSVFREEDIFADLMLESSAFSSAELVEAVINWSREHGVRMSMGMKARLR